MNQLSNDELKMVAALKEHPGYLLLLDRIQSQLDDMTDMLATETDQQRALTRLRYWQSLRSIFTTLKTTPESLIQQIESEREDMDPATRLKEELADTITSFYTNAAKEVKDNNKKFDYNTPDYGIK